MAIPHRSINHRLSQLFTEFPLIWFSNFEFLETKKINFSTQNTFLSTLLPVELCLTTQTPHSISYARGVAHKIRNSALKNSFRITGLQDCNKRHTTPNFLS
jgi:hypothetical protein